MFGFKFLPPGPFQTRKDLVKEIFSFKNLIPNWDGFGAVPFEVKSAANAVELIHFLDETLIARVEEIYPNPNGTISLVWRNEAEEEISVEIGNETISYYVHLLDQEPLFRNRLEINRPEMEKLSFYLAKL